jgi:hypothetical protein
MDVLTIILSAILSVVFTIPSMLLLYHKWIIPKILAGVSQQLPPAIIKVVDEKIDNFKDYLDEQIDNVKMSVLGKMGGSKRTIGLINKFFEKSGITDETIQMAIEKYGEDLVNKVVKKSSNEGGNSEEPALFGTIS